MRIAARRGWLLVATLAVAAAPVARAADPARLAAAERALARGVAEERVESMIRARAEFEALARAEPQSAILHYWVALADWRLTPRIQDPKRAKGFCADGLEHAERALALDPRFGEALAIQSSLLGLSLRFDPGAMMSLGPEIEGTMRRAVASAPRNPRVALLDGINTLNKPAFVGGGAAPALAKLLRADSLFAAESLADSLAPRWGREEGWIWAGRSAAALKDYAAARLFYHRVLAAQPANAWVRGTLLPELQRAAAADSAAADSGRSSAP